MLSTACTVGRHAGHDVWPHHADQPHVIAEDLVLPPFFKCLVDAERETKVDGAREVLLRSVEPMQCRQFLGAQYAERFENFRTDFVLTTVSSGGGGQHRAM